MLWLGVYLALVLAPVFVLLLGPTPAGWGFWWDFSMALGFAGLAMMGVQFVLTARFKRATAPYGIDIIYYFHRYLGVLTLLLILAHPVVLIIDNPATSGFLDPRLAPWHMTAGVLSIVALLAVVVSSLARHTLRLAYEPWRVLHTLLAVAAVLLALVHVDGVQYYIASPWKQMLWRTFTLTWIAVIVYVRFVRPWQLSRRPYRVVDVVSERGDAWTLAVEPIGHVGFTFQPGQFAWATLGASPFVMQEHPFSFSSAPTSPGGRLEFTIKELGDFTRTIGQIPKDTLAYIDGPYGAFTPDRHSADGYVFIAGGIGIAPIMSMLRCLADRGDQRPLLLIYAYRRWERMTFREDLEALRLRLNLSVVYVLQEPPDEWQGERGWVTPDMLARLLPDDRASRQYFICGPTAMNKAMETFLSELNVPMSRVHSELFELV
jgi:predicted ferric reductase